LTQDSTIAGVLTATEWGANAADWTQALVH